MIEERIYYADGVNCVDEIGEYVENYVFEKRSKFNRKKLFTIKLGKIKFAIFIVENKLESRKIVLLKTKNLLDYGVVKINDLKEKFDTDLCFIVSKSPQEKYEFLVENLLEKIINDMEYYIKI